MRRVMGVFMLLFGFFLLAWVGYNLFIERLPATEGHSPIPGLIFSAGLIYVGIMWLRDRRA